MGIQSLPLSKSKRKFRLRRITMHWALSAALWAVLLFLPLTGSRLAFAQGGLQRVNHIIIVMQENHSFDNYFGALAYAPGSPYHNANGACLPSDHKCVDGLSCVADVSGNLTCSNSNLEDDGSTVVAFHDPSRCVIPDLDHSWFGTHKQVNFLNPNSTLTNFLSDGFVRVNDVAGQLDNGTETSTEDQTMGFYNQNDIPFYYDLAQKFAIDDRYFASVLGPTFPNRSYLMAATSFGHVTSADTFPRREDTSRSAELFSTCSPKTEFPGQTISRMHRKGPASFRSPLRSSIRTSCRHLFFLVRRRGTRYSGRCRRSPSSIPISASSEYSWKMTSIRPPTYKEDKLLSLK